MEITVGNISNKQRGFRKGKSCMDQMFVIKMGVKEYLGKGKTMNAAFMALQKHMIGLTGKYLGLF